MTSKTTMNDSEHEYEILIATTPGITSRKSSSEKKFTLTFRMKVDFTEDASIIADHFINTTLITISHYLLKLKAESI